MQIEWLTAAPPQLGRQQAVSALLGPDVATDVQTLGLIQGQALAAPGGARGWRLLPALRRQPQPAEQQQHGGSGCDGNGGRGGGEGGGSGMGPAAAPSLDAASAAAAAAAVGMFRLNDAQAGVAAHVASWLPAMRQRTAEGDKGQAARRPALAKPAAKQQKVEGQGDAGGGGEVEATAAAVTAGPPGAPVCLVHGALHGRRSWRA